MPRRGGVVLAFALFCAPLIAGDQPKVKATVDVVAVTPVDGVGIDAAKYPANVRRMKPDGSVTAALVRQGASVAQSDAQSNPFQPDIELRGFVVSPLLGTPQGVAVLQDGVRINEPFGDTINWDLIPENAIESIETIPGSNAAFGLNALGGVITLRTKSGFSDRGVDARVAAGSFGRNTIEAADGFSRGGNAWFVAASADDDGGWRDFSPSRLRHLFASMQHIRDSGTSDVRLTLGDTNLTGNGTVPVQLLALDRRAVFTFPDSTHNRAGVLSSAHDVLVGSTLIEINASVRRTSTATINGDAAGDASNVFDGVLNRSTLDQTGFGFASQISRTAGRNRWTAGISFDSGDAQFRFRQELAHVTPSREVIGAGIIDPDSLVSLGTTTRTPAAYATDFISVTPRVSILAAARVNDSRIRLHDHIGTALAGSHRFVSANPSIGATFAVWQQLTLFANANQASRAPTPVELTCANPADPCLLPNAFVSDPPLEQVFARTIEAGARGQRGGVQWSVDAFRTANENDIV
ncbi:MAG TPA: TonB-dependent receptor, partial [Thermoanaerobaculia bacterium]|nr:TonB-dependent receptor [Thermoanaerobaculia bacterium]